MKFFKKAQFAYRKFSHTRKLDQGDVILASYPKCGNTFCRFVIANILKQKFNLDPTIDFQNIQRLTPAIGYPEFEWEWPYDNFPRVIKTHRRFNSNFKKARWSIYIMRDPRDMLLSYYNWMKAHKAVNYSGSLLEFAQHEEYGVSAYIDHIDSWKDHWDYLFKYEDLLGGKGNELFSDFFDRAGFMKIEPEIISSSVELSMPQNVRKVEIEGGNKIGSQILDAKFRHVRSGKLDQWKEDMPEPVLEYIYENHGDFLTEFDYPK